MDESRREILERRDATHPSSDEDIFARNLGPERKSAQSSEKSGALRGRRSDNNLRISRQGDCLLCTLTTHHPGLPNDPADASRD